MNEPVQEQDTLEQACKRYGITATAERGATDEPCFDVRGMIDWRVTIRHLGSPLSVDFYQGRAHKEPPTVAEVLGCLLSDARVSDARSFEEWAEELGYDSDSRQAERVYKRCLEIGEKLEALLGADLVEELSRAEH